MTCDVELAGLSAFWPGCPALRTRKEFAFQGDDDGASAVADVGFREDPQKMCLHRGLADEQATSDLGVGQAVGDRAQHVPLAGGERDRLGAA